MEEKIIDSISIVTFISNREKFNVEILGFYNNIKKFCEFAELIVFSDVALLDSKKIYGRNIYEKVCPNMTKYKRILLSLSMARSDKILYLDNDISPNDKALYDFLKAYRNGTNLYFGRIGVNVPKSVMEELVKIDKNISHKIIRPMLWKYNIGISVPGQVFMISKDRFAEDLEHWDTVFDDLFIGVCAKENKYIVQRSALTLGYEKASSDIRTLFKQRIRWAKGYYQTLLFNRKKNVFPLIIIHGIAYHFTIIAINIVLILLAIKYQWISVMLWLGICLYIGNFKEFPFSALYIIVFPIIHFVWFLAFLENIVKGMSEKRLQVNFKE